MPKGRPVFLFAAGVAALIVSVVAAQQPAVAPGVPPALTFVPIHPIEPPARPLPAESKSANVTKFSFIAYGDTRNGGTPAGAAPVPGDGVLRGATGAQWNVSFTPIAERLTRVGGVPLFFSVGNHDVTGMPAGDPGRMMGLHNALTAFSKLMPPEGSPRRLSGYPTYTFGYGNSFFIALDSNIAGDALQLAWVADQLEHLDR